MVGVYVAVNAIRDAFLLVDGPMQVRAHLKNVRRACAEAAALLEDARAEAGTIRAEEERFRALFRSLR